MNMIIPFIAVFLPSIALREIKCISNVAYMLSRVSNVIDRRQLQKRKNKEYDETRSVFYISWYATM